MQEKSFEYRKVQFIDFFPPFDCAFGVTSKNILSRPISQRFSPLISSESFIVICFLLKLQFTFTILRICMSCYRSQVFIMCLVLWKLTDESGIVPTLKSSLISGVVCRHFHILSTTVETVWWALNREGSLWSRLSGQVSLGMLPEHDGSKISSCLWSSFWIPLLPWLLQCGLPWFLSTCWRN